TTTPTVTSGPPVTAAPGPPTIITTWGGASVVVGGDEIGPDVDQSITDAVDDLAGGLVVETDDAIWHWPAAEDDPVKLVDELPGGNLNLIDVTVDNTNAATTVIYTDLPAAETPIQALYRLQLDAAEAVEPVVITQVGGVEFAVTNGGAGGVSAQGQTLVSLAGSDGPCSDIVIVDFAGDHSGPGDRVCVAEGGGTAGIEELIRATDMTHDGRAVVLDGTSLTHPDGRTLDLSGAGPTATLDLWEPWALVLTSAEGDGEIFLVELIEGTVEQIRRLPDPRGGVTSARLARSTIELDVVDQGTEVDFVQPLQVDPGDYVVVDVALDDQLNVRSGPGTQYPIEGGVPNGGIVTATGEAVRHSDGAEWYELARPEGEIVWANARFLQPIGEPGGSDSFADLACLVDPDQSSDLPDVSPANGSSDADHVAGVRFIPGDGCFRTVIEFGTEFDFEQSGPPANQLPGGIEVRDSGDGLSILVELPPEISEVALGSAVDAGPALVIRDEDFRPYIEILAGRHTAGARFLSDSARVVVDYVPADPLPDEPFFPLYEEAGIIIRSIDGVTIEGGDLSTAQYRPPIAVTGFARPFEANIGLTMFDSQGEPFGEVMWSSAAAGETTGSQSFTMTTDWSSAWGVFSFRIESIPAGEYVVRLSGDGGSDDPRFLDIPITVEP
ncbi:MAG: SH3 domain-containing protein, partial [Acidimicrobiales bacterium]